MSLNNCRVLQERVLHSFSQTPASHAKPSPNAFSQVFPIRHGSMIACHVDGNELTLSVVHLNDEHKREFFALKNVGPQRRSEAQLSQTEIKLQLQGQIVRSLHLNYNLGVEQPQNTYLQYTLLVATSHNLVYNIDFNPYYLRKGDSVVVKKPISIGDHLANSMLTCFEMASDPDTLQRVFLFGLQSSPQVQPLTDIGSSLQILYLDDQQFSSFEKQGWGISKFFSQTQASALGSVLGGIGKFTKDIALQGSKKLGQKLYETYQHHAGRDDLDEIAKKKLQAAGGQKLADINQALAQSETVKEYQPLGDEVGVVGVCHFKSQSAVGALFSDGTLRVRKLSSFSDLNKGGSSFLVDRNLLDLLPPPQILISQDDTSPELRIAKAKLLVVPNSEESVETLGLAYEVLNLKDMRSVWRYEKFTLDFKSLDADNHLGLEMLSSQVIDDTINQKVSLLHLVSYPVTSDSESSQKEEMGESIPQTFHDIFCYIWNHKLSSGEFRLVDSTFQGSSPEQPHPQLLLMNAQAQERVRQVFEQFSDEELQQLNQISAQGSSSKSVMGQKEFEGMVRDRLQEQMLMLHRFRPQVVQQVLKSNIKGWQGSLNQSSQSQLKACFQKLSIAHLYELKYKLVTAQQEQARALCLNFSDCHNLHHDTFFANSREFLGDVVSVTPITLSLFRESVSPLIPFQDIVDTLIKEGQDLVDKCEDSTFSSDAVQVQRQIVFGKNDTKDPEEMFQRILSSLFLVLGPRMSEVESCLLDDPESFPSELQRAFSSDKKFEQIHSGLQYQISTHFSDLSQYLDHLQKEILNYFNSSLPQKGDELKAILRQRERQTWNEKGSESSQLTKFQPDLLLYFEQSALADLQKLTRLISSIFMFKEYMAVNGLGQLDSFTQEDSQAAVRADINLRARFLQLLAINQIFKIQFQGQPQNSSLLQELAQRDPMVNLACQEAYRNGTLEVVDGLLSKLVSVHANPFHPLNFSVELLRHLTNMASKATSDQLNSQLCQFLKLFPTASQFSKVFGGLSELEFEYQELLVEFHRAFSIARLEEQSKDGDLKQTLLDSFMSKIDFCLTLLFKGHLSPQINLRDFSVQNIEVPKSSGSDPIYQAVLEMAAQFTSFEKDVYQVRILSRALEHLQTDSLPLAEKTDLRNLMLGRVFVACKSGSEESLKMMIDSCLKMENLQQPSLASRIDSKLHPRAYYIHKLFEQALKNSSSTRAIRQIKFLTQKSDLDSELRLQFERLEYLLVQQRPFENPSERDQILLKNKAILEVTAQMSSNTISGSLGHRVLQLQRRIRDAQIQEGVAGEIDLQLAVILLVARLHPQLAERQCEQLHRSISSFKASFLKVVAQLNQEFEDLLREDEGQVECSQLFELTESMLQRLNIDYLQTSLRMNVHLFHLFTTVDQDVWSRGQQVDVSKGCYSLVDDTKLVQLSGTKASSPQAGLKRFYDEISSSDAKPAPPQTIFDLDTSSVFMPEEASGLVILAGTLEKIRKIDIAKNINLLEGQLTLVSHGYLMSPDDALNEPEFVAQVLSELGHHQRAILVAVQSQSSVSGLVIGNWIAEITQQIKQAPDQIDWLQVLALTKGVDIDQVQKSTQSSQISEVASGVLEKFIGELKGQNLISVASILIDKKIILPETLSQKISQSGLVNKVVKIYLNSELAHYVGLSKFLTGSNPENFEANLNHLMNTEPQLLQKLVSFIEEGKEFIEILVDQFRQNLRSVQERELKSANLQAAVNKDLISKYTQQLESVDVENLVQLQDQGSNDQAVSLFELVSQVEESLTSEDSAVESKKVKVAREKLEKVEWEQSQLLLLDLSTALNR